MDESTGAGADRVLRLQLEVQLDRQPVLGLLRTEWGTEEHFVGWLGFVDALRQLHDELMSKSSSDRPNGASGDSI